MAALSNNALTLLDWAKRLDPDGKVPKIAELLSEQNSILEDMTFMEGNLPTGHRTTIRTGLPTVYWRLVNQGVAPSKSATAQIDEQCGMLEAYSEVDKDLAMLQGNLGAFRLSEASAFLEAMNQEMADTLFNGNAGAAPEEFNGLQIRYNDSSAESAQNVINYGAGEDVDIQSVWLVSWGSQTVHGIFPKGSKAGLHHEDLGLQTVQDAAVSAGASDGIGAGRIRVYQDHFQWKAGLVVRDWRYVARVANVDVGEALAASGGPLIEAMVKATHRIPSMSLGKPCFYMSRSLFQVLDIQRMSKIGSDSGSYGYSNFKYDDVDGKIVPTFRGIPIKICDVLDQDETVYS